ncbi:MAG: lysine exporter LysO family protein [Rikenellaceae bacterium]
MKGSLIIVGFFALGVVLGLNLDVLNKYTEYSSYVLYALMFTVGVSIGCDKKTLNSLRNQDLRVVLLPVATIIGTTAAGLLLAPLMTGMSLREVLAVASGFGYYSLSSIIITEYSGAEIGTIALIANIVREIMALLLAPIMVRWFSPLALISAAGATSLDTLLPIITRFSGKEFVVISIFHGLVMELTVPVLVTLFIS